MKAWAGRGPTLRCDSESCICNWRRTSDAGSGFWTIRFPSMEALNAWFASQAYQSLIPIRERAAEMILLSYEEPS